MSIKMYYQYCSVPYCGNNTNNTPNKLFISVPRDHEKRKKWLQLAKRDWKELSMHSTIFFCEDHFDLPEDMENYMQYSIQGHIRKIRMKDGCLPSRFGCQSVKKRPAPMSDHAVIERQRQALITEALENVASECPNDLIHGKKVKHENPSPAETPPQSKRSLSK